MRAILFEPPVSEDFAQAVGVMVGWNASMGKQMIDAARVVRDNIVVTLVAENGQRIYHGIAIIQCLHTLRFGKVARIEEVCLSADVSPEDTLALLELAVHAATQWGAIAVHINSSAVPSIAKGQVERIAAAHCSLVTSA